jgi:small-conductance mechanosensitive channel
MIALAMPALAADAPASADTSPRPASPTAPDTAEPVNVADLQRQLADTQDKLATALHSYTVLEDENTRLKDESEAETLRTQVRQLRDQVAELSAENAKLKTRIALLGPLPGGAGSPGRPAPTPANAP